MHSLSKLSIILLCFIAFASNADSSGTAFSVANGYLLTNHHVVAGCSSLDLITADGRRPATVLDSIKEIDLALVRVYGLRGPIAKFRKSGQIRLGEPIHIFGFPLVGALSSRGNFTTGTISSLRGFKDAAGEIQITAPVQPGNSGGPVLDVSGYVVGVVSSKLDALKLARSTGDVAQNVNFAVSLDVVEDFLEKNKIVVQDAGKAELLTTDKVAEIGQGFTFQIQCNSSDQKSTNQGVAAATTNQCPEPYSETTWDNCVGRFLFTDGSVYTGSYRRGKESGLGTYLFKNGDEYRGNFIDGRAEGSGSFTFTEGTKYRGNFLDWSFDGKGLITFPNGESYEGDFKNAQKHGEGKIQFSNGDVFVGAFVNGERHGRGTYLFKSGTKYVGDYKNSQRDGYGVLTDESGSIVYAGQWVAGKRKDTPSTSNDGGGATLVRLVQVELNRLGFGSGVPDGVLGPQTQGAISKAQRSFNIREDGVPSETLLNTLRRQSSPRAGTGPMPTPFGYMGVFVNLATMATGVSILKDNLNDAETEANKSCVQNSGGRTCEKLMSGSGARCLAIAIGNQGIGGAARDALQLARSLSLEQCQKYATPSSCTVKYEYCFTQ
jgi:hypothetical protein